MILIVYQYFLIWPLKREVKHPKLNNKCLYLLMIRWIHLFVKYYKHNGRGKKNREVPIQPQETPRPRLLCNGLSWSIDRDRWTSSCKSNWQKNLLQCLQCQKHSIINWHHEKSFTPEHSQTPWHLPNNEQHVHRHRTMPRWRSPTPPTKKKEITRTISQTLPQRYHEWSQIST